MSTENAPDSAPEKAPEEAAETVEKVDLFAGQSDAEVLAQIDTSEIPQKSPRRAMASAILALEGLTLMLVTPVMIGVEGVSTGAALGIGLGLGVFSILLSGMLRKEWGYWAGYVLQAAAIGLGFVVSTMFILGGIFALLWVMADVLGRKIFREKTAAWEAFLVAEAREGRTPDVAGILAEED